MGLLRLSGVLAEMTCRAAVGLVVQRGQTDQVVSRPWIRSVDSQHEGVS